MQIDYVSVLSDFMNDKYDSLHDLPSSIATSLDLSACALMTPENDIIASIGEIVDTPLFSPRPSFHGKLRKLAIFKTPVICRGKILAGLYAEKPGILYPEMRMLFDTLKILGMIIGNVNNNLLHEGNEEASNISHTHSHDGNEEVSAAYILPPVNEIDYKRELGRFKKAILSEAMRQAKGKIKDAAALIKLTPDLMSAYLKDMKMSYKDFRKKD